MKLIKNIFKIILLTIIIVGGIKIYEGYNKFKDALEDTPLKEKVEQIKSIDNYTTLDELPEMYKKAVIAAEDHRFYLHKGLDVISTLRAVWINITSLKLVEGGSTITQQLAKNSYFTQAKDITRKIAEIFMAFEYEKNYSKEEILEFYLNTSYYGEGCYTVKDASNKYFGKEPINMSDYESILLAGIPNAPSVYAPTVNPDLAKQRQLQVIRKMIKCKALSEEEAKEILEGS